jgi:ADP-ribosylglycohydrolase
VPRPTPSQYAGCLIGQCLGDALGFPVEGHGCTVCQHYVDEVVKPRRVQRVQRGRFPFGQYSDDSQLARELILSFVECGCFQPPDYARRIAALFVEDRVVGRGLATQEAATRLASGVPWEEAGASEPAAGNGSAMRAGPVGLFFPDHPDGLVRCAHDQGRITHRDRRCSAGAIAIAGSVALAMKPGPLDPSDFVAQLSELTKAFDPVLAEALLQMPAWLRQPTLAAAQEIATVGIAPGFQDVWQWISPFVTASVLWSIYSFLQTPDDYMQAVSTAIAAGGDVDTTAAMTGAISGARVGLEQIPDELAQLVNDDGSWGYDSLLQLSHRCHAMVSTQLRAGGRDGGK